MRPQVFRGDRLRAERRRHGLTQHELSRLIGAGQNQIARYENALGEPSVAHVVNLALALHITTDYLLGLSDDPQPPPPQRKLTPDEARFLEALVSDELGPVLRRLLSAYSEVARPQTAQPGGVPRAKVSGDG